MNPERWQRIEELFRTVIDRPADEREAYLTRVCGGDEELRREVLSLLAQDTAEDFIRDPIAQRRAISFSAKPDDDLTGERIGPYRVTRLIGRGGMGDGLRGRARRRSIPTAGRDQDHQARDGHGLRARPIPARAADSGLARSSAHRAPARRRRDGGRLALLRDGIRRRRADHRLLPTPPAFAQREAEALPQGLLRRAARASETGRPPRPQTEQHPGHRTGNGAPKLLDFGIAKLLTPDPGEAHHANRDGAADDDARLRQPGTGARAADHDGDRRLFARRRAL